MNILLCSSHSMGRQFLSGALKIVLGAKHFTLYLTFVLLFSLVTGTVVNFIVFCL